MVIPKQYPKDALVIEGVEGSSKTTAAIVGFASLLALNPIIIYFINKLLGMISALGFITHFCLLNLDYPLNLLNFFAQLFPLIAFDFLPTEWYTSIFALEGLEDEPLTDQFDTVGYGNKSLLYDNLGSLLIFMLSMPVSIFFARLINSFVLWLFTCSCRSKCKKENFTCAKLSSCCRLGRCRLHYWQMTKE